MESKKLIIGLVAVTVLITAAVGYISLTASETPTLGITNSQENGTSIGQVDQNTTSQNKNAKKVNAQRQICKACNGSGWDMCMVCGGTGKEGNITCEGCNGIGKFKCDACKGDGYYDPGDKGYSGQQ